MPLQNSVSLNTGQGVHNYFKTCFQDREYTFAEDFVTNKNCFAIQKIFDKNNVFQIQLNNVMMRHALMRLSFPIFCKFWSKKCFIIFSLNQSGSVYFIINQGAGLKCSSNFFPLTNLRA